MRLDSEEQAMLAGEGGPALQRAMQIVVTLGRIYDAGRLLPVHSVQVAGVSYRNLGEAGLEFLRDWAAQGARVRVPTALNPAGMDLLRWQNMGISETFARQQQAVIAAYEAMGIAVTCTCTPYLVGNMPGLGAHLAWSESSAVCFANAALGARTNREGGPSALAAAICGRTAAYGLHLDAQRRATHRVAVRCAVRSLDEFAALGYLIGQQVQDGVPYFQGLELPPYEPMEVAGGDSATADALKMLGAALASSGCVALYHVEGVTPEARLVDDLCPLDAPKIIVDSLQPAFEALNANIDQIDLVVIGCPHASPREIMDVAALLKGRRLVSALWITTARDICARPELAEAIRDIEQAGGQVLADGCVVVAPMRELSYRTLATNSAKMACYAPAHAGLPVRFGSLEQCMRAAISGRWDAQ